MVGFDFDLFITKFFLVKDDGDYQGRSFMNVPQYTGTNLRTDYVPERCYPPTKQMYTFNGHQKSINAMKWFPKSAHMFLSCAMDSKVLIIIEICLLILI